MARTPFDPATHLQVFAGSKNIDLYMKHAGIGCCDSVYSVADRLADIVHGPNSYTHLNPVSFNEKFNFPRGLRGGDFETPRNDIVQFINDVGVGAKIGVICIPNYAFITQVGVHVYGEEAGLTFNLKTRNGLELPAAKTITVKVQSDENNPCGLVRQVSEEGSFDGIGALDNNREIDIIGRDAQGVFSPEADEIILEVASMPSENKAVNGTFGIIVHVNYEIGARAERF